MKQKEKKIRTFITKNIILREHIETDSLTKKQQKYIKEMAEEDFYTWLILLKESRKIIGTVSIKIISERNKVMQFASTIIEREKKIDYSKYQIEALKTLAEYAITTLKFNRLQIICPANNRECELTAIRAGFLKETDLKEYYYDKEIDEYINGSVFSKYSHEEEFIEPSCS